MITDKIGVLKMCFTLLIMLQIVCSCDKPAKVEIKNASRNLIIKDTLKLTAYFDECGEFGGHREQIRIYTIYDTTRNDAGVLSADFLVDTIKCNSKRRRIFRNLQTKILVNSDETLILAYMDNLLQHSFNEELYSNAGEVYTVECEMPKISISYVNEAQKWNEFHKMKNSLFGKK